MSLPYCADKLAVATKRLPLDRSKGIPAFAKGLTFELSWLAAFGIFSLVVMPMLKVDPEEAKELFGKKEGESDAKQVQAPEKPQLTQKQSRGQKKHN